MTDEPIGRGTVLAGRFRLEDLVQDTDGARFWRAIDETLARSVAVNVIGVSDPRSDALLVAARTSATITEGHFLRVLDAAQEDGVAYVVHEWGNGVSLDKLLADGPLPPRRAAWLVKEVADAIAVAHAHGIAHGRLVPENVMVTEAGSVKLIGFVVDAVLHGRRQPATPDGRTLSDHESDVHNLAALLYATLVGKWPGAQHSSLPRAPRDHERTLRPRQVRAGVPRPLDAICDQVLNPSEATGSLETAQEICAALSDFIGDVAVPAGPEPTVVLRRDEEARRGSGAGGGAWAAGADSEATQAGSPATPATGTPNSADPEATQAAPPMFPDESTRRVAPQQPAASAASAQGRPVDPEATQAAPPMFPDEPTRRVAPAPPPPLPDPPERPLFAPGPPRASAERHAGADDPSGAVRGMHSTHGTGSLPPVWGPDATPGTEDGPGWGGRDTSRDWLKLAGAMAVIVLLVLAIVFAFNLGRGSTPSPSASPSGGATSSPTPAGPLRIAGISDLDPPPAGNGEENGNEAKLAIDGNPSTAWETKSYYGNPRFGNLKPGVGLVVDLGKQQQVSSVDVTVQGSPTSLDILAAPPGSGQPTTIDNLRKVATANGIGGRTTLSFKPVTTEYVVVWLTSLPSDGGAYRGRIAEIVVKG